MIQSKNSFDRKMCNIKLRRRHCREDGFELKPEATAMSNRLVWQKRHGEAASMTQQYRYCNLISRTHFLAPHTYIFLSYLPVHLPSFKVSTKHRVYWFYDDGFYSTCHPNIFLKEMAKMSIPSSNQNSFSLCVIIEHIFLFFF